MYCLTKWNVNRFCSAFQITHVVCSKFKILSWQYVNTSQVSKRSCGLVLEVLWYTSVMHGRHCGCQLNTVTLWKNSDKSSPMSTTNNHHWRFLARCTKTENYITIVHRCLLHQRMAHYIWWDAQWCREIQRNNQTISYLTQVTWGENTRLIATEKKNF